MIMGVSLRFSVASIVAKRTATVGLLIDGDVFASC